MNDINDIKLTFLDDNEYKDILTCGCAVAVGSFDGIHRGHRKILSALKHEASLTGSEACVFSFFESDRPKSGKKLLTDAEEKKALLKNSGVDILCEADFSSVKDLEAEDFVSEILIKKLNAKSVVCGYDFRFGKNRRGDPKLMKKIADGYGIRCVSVPPVLSDGTPVSSTLIRKMVSDGNIADANSLLGYKYSFSSAVISGNKIGRTLGIPTVNQRFPGDREIPKYGVYAVECEINGRKYGGVANIGIKPTVGVLSRPLCETHIFDFDGDLYGADVKISFVDFIREEKKFENLEMLSERAKKDAETAKRILEKEKNYAHKQDS